MTFLIFHGGVGEIGGNKILLEDRDTRVRGDKSSGEVDTLGRVREIYARQVKKH